MLTPSQLRRRFIQMSLLFPPQILVRLSSPEAYSRKKSIRDRLLNLFQDCLDNKDKLKERERVQHLQICLNAFHQI